MTAPRWSAEYAALAMVAADLHAQRSLRYPALVEKGKLTPAASADGLRIAAAIAADWRAIADETPQPEALASKAERIATLEAAAKRSAELAAADPGGADKSEYAELVATLLWHERQPLDPFALRDLTRELRARVPPRAQAA